MIALNAVSQTTFSLWGNELIHILSIPIQITDLKMKSCAVFILGVALAATSTAMSVVKEQSSSSMCFLYSSSRS